MEYSSSTKMAKGGKKMGGYVGDSGVAIGIQQPYSPSNNNTPNSKKL